MNDTTPLSHQKQDLTLEDRVQTLKQRSIERGDLPEISVDQQLAWIDELQSFPLGRFLLMHRGLNGYWTDYILLHPFQSKRKLPEMEDFILNRSPVVRATQERFRIFQEETQKLLCDNIHMASIPCGLMSDLLSLDYTGFENFKLTGIDIDKESLDMGSARAPEWEWIQADAWNLPQKEVFDLITSNGLNIYEPDEERVIALFQQFHQALKADGVLITSFLTPPSEWNQESLITEDVAMQKLLFQTVLEPKFQIFRSQNETEGQLKKAGFHSIRMIKDSQGIFPTVIAKK